MQECRERMDALWWMRYGNDGIRYGKAAFRLEKLGEAVRYVMG
jgi:hypothetical protein